MVEETYKINQEKNTPKEKSKKNAWLLCMGIIVNIACGDLFLQVMCPLKADFYMVIESVYVTQKNLDFFTYSSLFLLF